VEDTPHPHGAIVELLRPGYMLNGRLLRAARVSVASRPEETASPLPESPDPESVADEATPFLQPIPLPLEDTGEIVFDPVPDEGTPEE
jgi:hypothetical protein